YKNPERLKKSIKAQPNMYNGKNLKHPKLKVNLSDYKETFEDAEKSRLKMKDKMIPLDCPKLNKPYESFVPQNKISTEQTYLSPLATSNASPESSPQKSNIPSKKLPNVIQLLKLFVNLEKEINKLAKLIDIHLYIDRDKSFIYDNKADIRRIFSREVVLLSKTLKKCTKEIKLEITVEVHEMLEIFESMDRQVDEQSQKHKKFQKEFDRLLEASLEREVMCFKSFEFIRLKIPDNYMETYGFFGNNLSHRSALGMERDCQHGLYKAGMGSSRVLSDFAEKYGSKNRVLAGFGIGGKSGKEKVYKLGCDRERLKMN
ncbi:hypothetical protein Tco_0902462, partial [Tanacetum coccineum]